MNAVKHQRSFWTIAAVCAVCLTYANSFHNGFHFDDYHTIVDNPSIRSLRNVPRFFTDAATFSVLPANRTYRPMVSTTLAFDYWLGHGLNPLYFHLGTFLFFLLQIVAMQALFRGILDRVAPGEPNGVIAGLAALWYGLHPAMAETVNYVIQRGDIYSTLGVVAALALYVRAPRLRRTGLYLVPFVLAMLSKPPAIVFPVLLFAWVAMFEAGDGARLRTAAVRAMPAALVGVGLMVFEAAMTPKTFVASTLPKSDYLLTQPFVLLREFGTFFLPVHLNADTDLQAFHSLNAEALWGFLFVAALIALTAFLARRSVTRPIAFGLLWFLVASLPTSLYPLAEVENDHRMFMPFVGLALAVVWAGTLLLEQVAAPENRALRRSAVAGFLVLLGAYAWGAHVRNRVWRTEESLWLDDVQKCPHNGRGLMQYGLTQMNLGRYQVAREYFLRALRYTPNYPTLEINLGVVNHVLGNAAEAQAHFLRAIQLAPSDDEPHFYYGRALLDDGDLDEAVQQLRLAWRLNPARPATRNLLLRADALHGDTAAAQALARQTLALDPGDPQASAFLRDPNAGAESYWINASLKRYQQQDYPGCLRFAQRALALDGRSALAWNNIGAAEAAMGDLPAAIEAERHALQWQPGLAIARNNLADYEQRQAHPAASGATPEDLLNLSLRLNQAGQYAASIAAARQALRLRPGYAEAWNNVAAGYAAMKEWDAAIAAARQAIRLKPDFQLAKNNLAWAEAQKQLGVH